jgi:Flp pilus assembly protein TadG
MTASRQGRIRVLWRDDNGAIGGIEVLPLCILIFLVGSLLTVNVWGVIDAKLAVSSASREAVRAFVEAANSGSAGGDANAAAHEALRSFGRDDARLTIRAFDAAGNTVDSNAFQRCKTAGFEVSYAVPLISIPLIGSFGHGIIVRSRHVEVVDPFRSGVPGEVSPGAPCGGP